MKNFKNMTSDDLRAKIGENLEIDIGSYTPIVFHELYLPKNNYKTYISFDMISANFNTLRTIDKSLVCNCTNYKDFVRHFGGNEFLEIAKFSRKIFLGKICPNRTRAMEKFILTLAWSKISEGLGYDAFCFSSDELLMEMEDDDPDSVAETVSILKSFLDENELLKNMFKISAFKLYAVQYTPEQVQKIALWQEQSQKEIEQQKQEHDDQKLNFKDAWEISSEDQIPPDEKKPDDYYFVRYDIQTNEFLLKHVPNFIYFDVMFKLFTDNTSLK